MEELPVPPERQDIWYSFLVNGSASEVALAFKGLYNLIEVIESGSNSKIQTVETSRDACFMSAPFQAVCRELGVHHKVIC